MTFNIPFLLVALALLWCPRSWFHRGKTIIRSKRPSSRNAPWTRGLQDGSSLIFRREFTRGRNFVDFFRAVAGTWAIVGGYGIEPVIRGTGQAVILAQLAVLGVGMLIQTVRFERARIALTAPVFYLGGLTVALQMPEIGIAAFALAWALSTIVPNAQGFLTIQTAVFVTVGFFMAGLNLLLLAGAAFLFAPVLISLLSRRPLVVFSRRPAAPTRD